MRRQNVQRQLGWSWNTIVKRLRGDVDEVWWRLLCNVNRLWLLWIVNLLRLMLVILRLKRENLRGWWRWLDKVLIVHRSIDWPVIYWAVVLAIVVWQFCWVVNFMGLNGKVSAISTVAKTIGDVVCCVGDAIWSNVAVVSTHNFIGTVAVRLLLDSNCVVGSIFVAEASVWTTTVIWVNSLSIRFRVQIRWHLKLVIPTIYIMARLTVGRIIIAINPRPTWRLKQQCNEWWPEVLLREEKY